ncbi:hypothetical protein ABPG72_005160 [Tetrahymena utriculariae]
MKQQKLILAFFLLASCFTEIKAQNGFNKDIFLLLLQTYIKSPDFQYNLIQEFTKQFIFGEIKLFDLAVNHSKQIGSDQAKKIKEEVDGLVGILFQGHFSTLQDLVEDIKKNDPEALDNIFSKKTFNDNIKQSQYQYQLASAIAKKLIVQNQSQKEKLTQSIKNLDLIEKFFIQYRGVKEQDIEKVFSFLKDSEKLQKSMLFLSEKLADPKIAGELMKLASKFNDAQTKGIVTVTDILSLIQDDKALASILADQGWEDLLKLKDKLTKVRGKSYEEYINNGGGSGGRDNDDQDKDDDEKEEEEEDLEGGKRNHQSIGIGKIFLIIIGVVSVIVIAFLIYRKYNQSKYNDSSYTENKQLYRPTV